MWQSRSPGSLQRCQHSEGTPGSTQGQRQHHPKGEVIYRYRCDQHRCNMEYIGGKGRSFGERYKEHLRAPCPILNHFQTIVHNIILENFSIVGRKSQGFTRTIKEAMFIRVNDPPLNRNLGKNQLPHIWVKVLQDMLALHFGKAPTPVPLPHWHYPKLKGGTIIHILLLISMFHMVPLSPNFHLHNPHSILAQFLPQL